MLHPYLSIGTDETEVLCSDAYVFDGITCFDVHIETATDAGFEGLIIQLPTYVVKKEWGAIELKRQYWLDFAKRNSELMWKYAVNDAD